MTAVHRVKEAVDSVETIRQQAQKQLREYVYAAAQKIKDEFFEASFCSDDNWLFAVNSLKRLSEIDARAVREALKYEFPEPTCSIKDYQDLLTERLGEEGKQIVNNLYNAAKQLKDKKKIVVINATFVGGGPAEMFRTAGPLLKELGVELEWHIPYPFCAEFYSITKTIHNAMQGKDTQLSENHFDIWDRVNSENAYILRDIWNDPEVAMVFLEDPQPLPMTAYVKKENPHMPVTYRKHVDTSGLRNENPGAMEIWKRMKEYLLYLDENDAMLFQPAHVPEDTGDFRCKVLTQYPGLDLLYEKNRKMSDNEAERLIEQINLNCGSAIDTTKPNLVTGARFDYWKGLVVLMRAFERVAGEFDDVDLVVFGNYAPDDPEGVAYFDLIRRIREKSAFKERIHLVYNQEGRYVSALYRLAAKYKLPYCAPSIAEGYCLMTDEAAVQETVPFVSNIGGLKRYPAGEWRAEISEITKKIEDASSLYHFSHPEDELQAEEAASLMEDELAGKLYNLMQKRREQPEEHAKNYESYAQTVKNMATRYSMISMFMNYLCLAAADRSRLKEVEEKCSADKVSKLVENR